MATDSRLVLGVECRRRSRHLPRYGATDSRLVLGVECRRKSRHLPHCGATDYRLVLDVGVEADISRVVGLVAQGF